MASKLDRLQKKGFKVNEAALSKIARGDQEPGGEYSEININDIEENPDNALYRELDTEEDIALLADDIRRAGLLHNLVVFPKTGVGGKYVLLSGERRLRAQQLDVILRELGERPVVDGRNHVVKGLVHGALSG